MLNRVALEVGCELMASRVREQFADIFPNGGFRLTCAPQFRAGDYMLPVFVAAPGAIAEDCVERAIRDALDKLARTGPGTVNWMQPAPICSRGRCAKPRQSADRAAPWLLPRWSTELRTHTICVSIISPRSEHTT
jgi:hypothetical protein